jgi:hypothetical protein
MTKFYKTICIRKTIEFKKEKVATRHALEGAQERLQNNTQYTSLQQVIRELKDKVRVLEHVKVEGTYIRSRTRWMDKGNWCSKEFLKAVGERRRSSIVSTLSKLGGTPTKLKDHKRIGISVLCILQWTI